jgi:hypothetical protein
MAEVRLFLALFALATASAQVDVKDILSRAAEEADALRENLPKALTQETLEQRTLVTPPARLRVGASATQVLPPKLQVRHVVSEYTVAPLKGAQNKGLVEYRQVLSVDGRMVQSEPQARRALSLGAHSLDDRLRKRMLEDLAKFGLIDIATDYGLILLEFTGRGQENIEIQPAGRATLGTDEALVFSWHQKSETGGELEFLGRQVARHALEGRLWVRRSDLLPLRIEAWAEHPDGQHRIRDEATVEYAMTSRGFLAPASVYHRHSIDGQAVTENRYAYATFKVFGADAEIKFDEVPEPPPQK